ncbi:MAG: DUF1624 domain-containing protein [Clostridiales bacterium]|nr:DUF1624 domain-containing protein [Clostridiales bacterium]
MDMQKNRHGRIEIIDAVRGLSILLMVLYHFFYDLVSFTSFPAYILFNPFVNFLQVLFASLFILMSGASTQFSRNNMKRAIKIVLAALAVTIITWWFDPEAYVKFGILHFLGVCALLYALFSKQIDRIVTKIHPAVFVILFIILKYYLDQPHSIPYLWLFGLYTPNFVSTDYFPIFPWMFIYLFGIWFGKLILAGKLPALFYDFKSPFFASAGRKTLWIYLLHQPILMGIIELIKFMQ